ncbi:SWPV1-078 [Shearwaterpox virus]|uniref:SWPV1-078 n=1 Tax=Shearwaterpox virus TaxID=1974596 RepID=A0A1V0QGW5_CNPV|nr:SWPV1-078 [Shearwaterpox virus]
MGFNRIYFILYNYSEEDYIKIKSIDYNHIIISREVIESVPVISGYMEIDNYLINNIKEINSELVYKILDDKFIIDSYKKGNYEEYKKNKKPLNMIDLRIFDYYK